MTANENETIAVAHGSHGPAGAVSSVTAAKDKRSCAASHGWRTAGAAAPALAHQPSQHYLRMFREPGVVKRLRTAPLHAPEP